MNKRNNKSLVIVIIEVAVLQRRLGAGETSLSHWNHLAKGLTIFPLSGIIGLVTEKLIASRRFIYNNQAVTQSLLVPEESWQDL